MKSGFLLGGSGEIDDDLREFGNDTGELAEGLVSGGHNFGDHKGSKKPIAGRLAWENDVTGLFPAEFDMMLAHSGSDMRVADRGDFGVDVGGFGPVEEALIGHDGNGDLVET